MPRTVHVSAAVEGLADEAVARKLIRHVGAEPGPIYGKHGKAALRSRVAGYNNAARRSPWLVLVDLDAEQDCAPPLRQAWLPEPAAHLCFRVAVRSIEAWLMADRELLADFLRIPVARVPLRPEALQSPKLTLVNLARHSRIRDIREDMAPRESSGRVEGPAYTSRVIEYVEGKWRPDVAARHAESLRKAIACLERLTESTTGGEA